MGAEERRREVPWSLAGSVRGRSQRYAGLVLPGLRVVHPNGHPGGSYRARHVEAVKHADQHTKHGDSADFDARDIHHADQHGHDDPDDTADDEHFLTNVINA